jgi:hypothetical protein
MLPKKPMNAGLEVQRVLAEEPEQELSQPGPEQ